MQVADSRQVYYSAIALCLGIGMIFLSEYVWVGVVCIAALLLWVYNKHSIFATAFVLLWLVVGLVRADITVQNNIENTLYLPTDTAIEFTGIVTQEPDVRDFNTRLTVRVNDSNTYALVKVPFYPEFNYGDKLSISGVVEIPEGFVGDEGRFFDYYNFLLKDGIRYISNYPTVTLVASGQASAFKARLFQAKHWVLYQLQTILPEPHVSLLGGLLLGAKSAMGEDLLEDFRNTGVIHIVVLSGFNITIVVWFLMTLLAFVGRRTSAIIGTVGIVCFAIITGAGATIMRASIMALLALLAKATGNYAAVTRMLCIAGMGMLLWNPMLLIYDPSFQLSFIATLGLIVLSPWIESYCRRLPNPKEFPLRELFAATVATQIAVTPFLLWMTGTGATYSLITNFLILTTVPYTMAVGFLAGLASAVSSSFALPLTALSYVLLEYQLQIVDLFANMAFSSFVLPPFSFAWVVGTYVLYLSIGYIVWMYYKK